MTFLHRNNDKEIYDKDFIILKNSLKEHLQKKHVY